MNFKFNIVLIALSVSLFSVFAHAADSVRYTCRLDAIDQSHYPEDCSVEFSPCKTDHVECSPYPFLGKCNGKISGFAFNPQQVALSVDRAVRGGDVLISGASDYDGTVIRRLIGCVDTKCRL